MRLNQRSSAAIGLMAFLAALAPRPLRAQDSAPTTPETLQVYSRETIVDVVVTDDNGRHVRGLKQSDFSVEEDDNPQIIRSFKESGLTAAKTRSQSKLPPGIYSNANATPVTGPVNIILIDSLNSHDPMLVALAQREIVEYLKAMPEGNQVAIFSLSYAGLKVLQGFTSDRALLLRCMDANFLVLGPNGEVIRRDWATIDALNQIAAYVSGIKGRKNLLWVAPIMPIQLTRDGGYQWGITDGLKVADAPDMTLVHRIMDTFELFTAQQIAVSPVSTAGIGLDMEGLRMEEVAEQTGGVAYHNNNDIGIEVGHAIDDGSHYYTLSYLTPHYKLAGHYHKIKITANRPGLHLVYRTGYNDEPSPQPATLTGPTLMQASMEGQAPPSTQLLFDLHISPIPGAAPLASTIPDPFYGADDPFAFANRFSASAPAAAPAGNAADPSSGQPATPDQTPVADRSSALGPNAGRRSLTNPNKVRYTFLFAVPQSQIAFTTSPDGARTGTLEFDVAAFNTNGRLINSLSQTMHMPLAPDEYADFIRTPFQFSQQLELPPGPAYLRAGVLDPTSNKVGTMEFQITVPKPSLTVEKSNR